MRIPKTSIAAIIVLLCAAPNAYADDIKGGIINRAVQFVVGSPGSQDMLSTITSARYLEGIFESIKSLNNGNQGQRGLLAGLTNVTGAVTKMGHQFSIKEGEKRTASEAGNQFARQQASIRSKTPATAVAALPALKPVKNGIKRAVSSMFGAMPANMLTMLKRNGIGGTYMELLAIGKMMCQSGGLTEAAAAAMAKNPVFAGCASNPATAGFAMSIPLLRAGRPQLGPSARDTNPFHAFAASLGFNRLKQAAVTMNGYRSMREMMQAELKEMQDQNGKIIPATYHPDQDGKGLLRNVATGNAVADTVRTLAAQMAYAKSAGDIISCVENDMTTQMPGSAAPFAFADAVNTIHGEPKSAPASYYPTANEQLEMVGAVATKMAVEQPTAAGTEGEVTGNILASTQMAASALGSASAPSGCSEAGAAGAIADSMMDVSMMLDSPEFQIFAANLDPKIVHDVTAMVEQYFEVANIQVAANYNAHLYRNNIPVMFAANGDRFPANMKGMLASVGVDKGSMLPVGGELQVANLAPILNMAQFDPIEPAQLQLAIRDSVETVTTLAQNEPIKAAIKAIPIAATVR